VQRWRRRQSPRPSSPSSSGFVWASRRPLEWSRSGSRSTVCASSTTASRAPRVVSSGTGALDYCRYLLFLPTLVAGPINRFPEFARDSRRRRWDRALCAAGLERMLYGYVKIVVLANYLVVSKLGPWGEGLGPPDSWPVAYLGCVTYGLNLYLQFAGYSDVAIGLALLVGFRVPENFHWPFAATNIHDFWQRWHITLSHWCRDYVFRPVGSLSRSPHLGVVASMLVLGLWHELSWRYCLWGLYHGLGLVVWRVLQPLRARLSAVRSPWLRRPVTALSWALTVYFVTLSFALTSADNLEQTWSWWSAMLSFGRW